MDNKSLPIVAKVFHSFPRVNFSFQPGISTFEPRNDAYLQGIIFWSACIGVWLILTLLVLIGYFFYHCCRGISEEERKRPHKITVLKTLLAVFTFFICVSIGLGFYANEEIARSVQSSRMSLQDIVDSFKDIETTVANIRTKLPDKFVKDGSAIGVSTAATPRRGGSMNAIAKAIGTFETAVNNLPRTSDEAKINFKIINKKLKLNSVKNDFNSIYEYFPYPGMATSGRRGSSRDLVDSSYILGNRSEIQRFIDNSKDIEFIRWCSTLVVLSWHLFICLMLFMAASRSSKSTFICCCILCVVTLVVSWAVNALYVAASIAHSDFCFDSVDSAGFIRNELKQRAQVTTDTFDYYSSCSSSSISASPPLPVERAVNSIKMSKFIRRLLNQNCTVLNSVNEKIFPVGADKIKVELSCSRYSAEVSSLKTSFTSLLSLVECRSISEDYGDALKSLCQTAMNGSGYLVLSLTSSALLFTVTVFFTACAWKRVGSKRQAYLQVQDESADVYYPPHGAGNSLRLQQQQQQQQAAEEQHHVMSAAPNATSNPYPSLQQRSATVGRYPPHGVGQNSHDMRVITPLLSADHQHLQQQQQLRNPYGDHGMDHGGGTHTPPPAYTHGRSNRHHNTIDI